MLSWPKRKQRSGTPISVRFGFEGDAQAPEPNPNETPEALFDEFSRTFCHRPEENFTTLLRKEEAWRLERWLKGDDAEAKAFVWLTVDSVRRGVPFWEQTRIVGFRHGSAPDQETQDALSVLAQYAEIPIKLYFETPKGETRVLDFHP